MKTLLIFPPQWTPFSPPLSLPVLTAYLRKNGIKTIQKDANAEFYNYIFSKQFIGAVKKQVDTFISRCEGMLGSAGNIYLLPEQTQLRYKVIKEIFKELGPWWPDLDANVDRAMQIIKTPEMFYQPLFLAESIFHLKYALQACGLAFFPSDLLLNYYSNRNYKLTVESLKQAAEDKEGNIFLNYYDNKLLQEVLSIKPDFVGISVGCNTQMVAGLTLARRIREILPGTHVNVGGNAFTRLTDVVEKRPEIFDYFCDSMIYGEGEKPLLSLIKALMKKKDFSLVPNLIYKDGNKTVINQSAGFDNLNMLPAPDYEGLNFSLYLSPDVIFPVQSSRGCYWKKCSFCDHDYGHMYSLKTPGKMVEELGEIVKKHKAKYFYFVDEAISPNYMKNMSQKITEKGLDISWFTCARAEEGFSEEVSKISEKAGLKMLLWGIESGAPRVLELINKGIDKETALKVLKNTHNAGIWNHCFFFFGFPSEDIIEAMETVNMIVENKAIINSYGMGPFSLGKYSPIASNPEKFFINSIEPSDEELSTATDKFTTIKGLSRQEVENFVIYNTEYCAEQYGYPLWMSIGGYKDHIFLYVDKFGPKVLSYSPDETVQAFGDF